MKNTKKIVALFLAAVMLVCTTVAATVAYLTATSEVANNTFTVGDIEIKLDEADVDVYGKLDSSSRVLKNEYKLLPGHEYIKDPTVTVLADSEESYVRMIVTITDINAVKSALGNDFLPQDIVTGWDPAIWETTGVVAETNNTAVYEFRYYKTVNTLDGKDLVLEPLFETIVMPDDIDNDTLAKLDGVNVDVIAYAIQADGFDTADKAWAEF